MSAAADWLKTQGSEHSSFLLFVDEFDPHEPFDTPSLGPVNTGSGKVSD